jgi:hypothetical protein
METPATDKTIEEDVLHLGSESHLSAEEIAKAVAHHNRHHGGSEPHDAAAKTEAEKKPGARKPGK